MITQYVLYCQVVLSTVLLVTCQHSVPSKCWDPSILKEQYTTTCLGVKLILTEHFSRGTNRDFRESSGISVNDCYHFKTETETNTHGMVCS